MTNTSDRENSAKVDEPVYNFGAPRAQWLVTMTDSLAFTGGSGESPEVSLHWRTFQIPAEINVFAACYRQFLYKSQSEIQSPKPLCPKMQHLRLKFKENSLRNCHRNSFILLNLVGTDGWMYEHIHIAFQVSACDS